MNTPHRSAAALAIAFGLLMFVPLIVLGQAIGWPASLDQPARTLMPLILEQQQAVRFGYGAYLVYSLLFFPVIASLGTVLGDTPTTRLAAQFAALSSLARSIGILRWLTVMPALAAVHASSNDKSLEPLFAALNTYGGGIGELLGVSLFGAFAIALNARAILLGGVLPAWLGWFGYATAFGLLLSWLEVFGLNLGPVLSLGVTLVQLWFLAVGVVLLRSSTPSRKLDRSLA